MILDDLKKGNNYPSQGEILFKSTDHIRYENGQNISGHNYGCNRYVKIESNIYDKEGYTVTTYNLDGNHLLWGNNIQMSPKPMKIISHSLHKIVLRGYGCDTMGGSFSDYGLSIILLNGETDKIILHMHDRNLDIEYLK